MTAATGPATGPATDPVGHLHGNRLPETGAGFVWDHDGVPVLRPLTSSAVAAFTTRLGGVSSGPYDSLNLTFVGDDDRDLVRRNREIAGAAIGRDGRWTVTRQVHGADVHQAVTGELAEGDGLWSDDPALTMAVLSADCVLLLLVGDGAIGVAHAGWRGLIAGVVEAAVRAVGAREVFAGPAIGPCCFEVGADVTDAFAGRYPRSVADATHVDLWSAAEEAATRAGAASFKAAKLCTSCRPELFFSHRRDRGVTGRQALVACVTG